MTGDVVGHYRLLEKARGRRSLGGVFRAEQVDSGFPVEIEEVTVDVDDPDDAVRVAGFLRAISLVSVLAHPYIEATYGVETVEDSAFVVREPPDGESLLAVLRRGRLDVTVIVRLGSQLAAALQALHACGLIHTGVHPVNVGLTPSGDARLMNPAWHSRPVIDRSLMGVDELVGLAAFMAPEQVAGAGGDARTDVYSLGAILYTAATGSSHLGDGPPIDLVQVLAAGRIDIRSPTDVNPDVPPALASIILKALAYDPSERHQSAAELGRDLAGIPAGRDGSLPGNSR